MEHSGDRPAAPRFCRAGKRFGLTTAALLWALTALAPLCAARTVTDEVGRRVDLPDHPRRLICLLPSIVDDVYALGAGADIVAVSDYSVYPPEAKTKRSVGAPLSPSIETIVALHPDLVLAEADLNPAETLAKLEKAHLTVFFIQPHGLEGIFKSLQLLGTALNRETQARDLVARLRARVAAVRQRSAAKPPISILMPIWYDPVLTIGRPAFITELIAVAGGRSVTADLPEEWPQISLETVLARAPQGILLVHGSPMTLEQIRNRPGWQSLPALKNNRIFYTDERLESPSPVAIDALEELARQLHP